MSDYLVVQRNGQKAGDDDNCVCFVFLYLVDLEYDE